LYLSDLCLSRKAIFIGFPKCILIATLYILCQTFLTLTPGLCYSSLVQWNFMTARQANSQG
jgi:hypothetical protein